MALQLSITNPSNGVTAIYWRVEDIGIGAKSGRATIVLNGYTSKNIRDSNGDRVATRAFEIAGDGFIALATAQASGALFDSIKAVSYAYIKANDAEFSAAADV